MSSGEMVKRSGTLLLRRDLMSPQETAGLAAELAEESLQPGDVVALHGNLGSGKTFFVKSLCSALDAGEATSPTFTIVNEYRTSGGIVLYHFDFYRIEHPAELLNLGLDDYFYSDGLCLIEWPERLGDLLPNHRYDLYLDPLPGNPQARQAELYRMPE